jgi:hypothetical protein
MSEGSPPAPRLNQLVTDTSDAADADHRRDDGDYDRDGDERLPNHR